MTPKEPAVATRLLPSYLPTAQRQAVGHERDRFLRRPYKHEIYKRVSKSWNMIQVRPAYAMYNAGRMMQMVKSVRNQAGNPRSDTSIRMTSRGVVKRADWYAKKTISRVSM
jgi:hypothetical protein